MCNRIVQDGRVIKPGERVMVLLRGPAGEFEVPYEEAVFGGPARSESRNYWLRREHAEPAIIPKVTGFGEKDKTTGQQNWEQLSAPAALEALLLPQPPGKAYRLLKVLTQSATPEQLAKLGNDRAPVMRRAETPGTGV